MNTTILLNLKKSAGRLLVPAVFLAFGTAGHAQYCTTTSNCNLDDEIDNVTFAGINKNSTCSSGGYKDYTGDVPASVAGGQSYPISVTVGEGGNEAIGVWIDYNQDEIFDADEFTYIGNVEGGETSATIVVPDDVPAGTTRMRVRNFYVATGDPETIYITTSNSSCAAISTGFGETEDYSVIITAGTDCAGTPVVGAATATVSSACSNTPFQLTANVIPQTAGLSYQWQFSTDGGETWNNLGSAQNNSSYTVNNQTQTTLYQVTVSCATSSESAVSAPVTITQNATADCYCTNAVAFNCTDDDMITNVTIGSINNTTGCANTATGYSDYSSSVAAAELAVNTTVPASVTVSDGWDVESVGIWIDYNHNGQFEESEFVYLGTGSDEIVAGNIMIPADALNGSTKMRVMVVPDASISADFSCGPLDEDANYGEMEDYAVTITGALSAASFGSGIPAVYPNPTSNIVTIKLGGNESLYAVDVYSITGQLVFSKKYPSAADSYILNMQDAASGMYLLKLQTANGTYTQKLVKR